MMTTTPPGTQLNESLAKLDLTSDNAAIIGLQYGDEGKGQIVDIFGSRYDIVARYNGGANAGHTVIIGDQKFALHLIPSGIMCQNAVNVIGNGVVIDPAQILKEIDGLNERGVSTDHLRISDRAHVVMPWHKIQDGLYDNAMATAKGSKAIGTTGRGIGPCYADKALRSTAIRMGELLKLDKLKAKVGYICEVKNTIFKALAEHCNVPFETLNADQIFEDLSGYAKRLEPMITDTNDLLHTALAEGKKILCEGANAVMLDMDHGTYPYVTSSNCSSLGIYPGTSLPGGTIKNIVGIVKLYTSRVGEGPFPTELFGDAADKIRVAGNEFGTTTGRPRRTGWLDCVSVRYAARLSGVTAIACTGLAVLAGLEQLKICVGYELNGKTYNTLPADADDLAAVKPIYEVMDGFADPIGDCRSYAQLPSEARQYVDCVEQHIGVNIPMVCVGRRRDQILFR